MSSIDYTASITQVANNLGVDPALALAVANQESGMNPNALGPVTSSGQRAVGLFQLLPSTAAGLGVDPNDPLQNIQGGVEYLSNLLNEYNGDVSLALAAYNAGPGNVAKYGGIPPFPETQNYVASILASLGLSNDSSDSGSDDSTNGFSDLSTTTLVAVLGLVGVGAVVLLR
jgi:soluble lytic murein transglycosylase-like protein